MAEQVPEEKNPSDQLLDLLLYAPVGLLYEYPEVMETLVTRGKSQVQLFKMMGQLAAKQGPSEMGAALGSAAPGGEAIGEAVALAAETITRGITELGAAFGLVPPSGEGATQLGVEGQGDSQSGADDAPEPDPEVGPDSEVEPELGIADYDELKAKEIVGLVGGLDADQREAVRSYESARRGRKTILAALDRLDR